MVDALWGNSLIVLDTVYRVYRSRVQHFTTSENGLPRARFYSLHDFIGNRVMS